MKNVSKLKLSIYLLLLASMIYLFFFGVPFISEDGDTGTKQIIEAPVDTNEYNLTSSGYGKMYESIKPGVVTVYSGGLAQSSREQGSGFVYDSSGHIVTNNHVVEGHDTFYIKYSNGDWSEASTIGTDKRTDLAVLEPSNVPEYVRPIPVASTLPRRGERVAAVGSPVNLDNSITSGIISGVNRTMESETGHVIPDTIQSDATLSIGNSGGPLINKNGVVVGVNRAKQGDTVSLAVSPRIVNRVVPSLIENGEHKHPFVGVRMRNLNPLIVDSNDYISESDRGIMVVSVVGGSPAASSLEAGTGGDIPQGGDVILEVDGTPIRDTEHFSSILILDYSPGDEVNMTVKNRDGNTETVTFELANQR